jgi:hypothetical protein
LLGRYVVGQSKLVDLALAEFGNADAVAVATG